MANDESPADRRFREWQEREAAKAAERERKGNEARDREIDERISYGMNDREARGRDSCLVVSIALAGGAAGLAALVAKGVGSILRH